MKTRSQEKEKGYRERTLGDALLNLFSIIQGASFRASLGLPVFL